MKNKKLLILYIIAQLIAIVYLLAAEINLLSLFDAKNFNNILFGLFKYPVILFLFVSVIIPFIKEEKLRKFLDLRMKFLPIFICSSLYLVQIIILGIDRKYEEFISLSLEKMSLGIIYTSIFSKVFITIGYWPSVGIFVVLSLISMLVVFGKLIGVTIRYLKSIENKKVDEIKPKNVKDKKIDRYLADSILNERKKISPEDEFRLKKEREIAELLGKNIDIKAKKEFVEQVLQEEEIEEIVKTEKKNDNSINIKIEIEGIKTGNNIISEPKNKAVSVKIDKSPVNQAEVILNNNSEEELIKPKYKDSINKKVNSSLSLESKIVEKKETKWIDLPKKDRVKENSRKVNSIEETSIKVNLMDENSKKVENLEVEKFDPVIINNGIDEKPVIKKLDELNITTDIDTEDVEKDLATEELGFFARLKANRAKKKRLKLLKKQQAKELLESDLPSFGADFYNKPLEVIPEVEIPEEIIKKENKKEKTVEVPLTTENREDLIIKPIEIKKEDSIEIKKNLNSLTDFYKTEEKAELIIEEDIIKPPKLSDVDEHEKEKIKRRIIDKIKERSRERSEVKNLADSKNEDKNISNPFDEKLKNSSVVKKNDIVNDVNTEDFISENSDVKLDKVDNKSNENIKFDESKYQNNFNTDDVELKKLKDELNKASKIIENKSTIDKPVEAAIKLVEGNKFKDNGLMEDKQSNPLIIKKDETNKQSQKYYKLIAELNLKRGAGDEIVMYYKKGHQNPVFYQQNYKISIYEANMILQELDNGNTGI